MIDCHLGGLNVQHAWAYATDQRLREENEDSFGVFQMPGYTLLLVCDGMGGHAGGAQASALAVRTIWERMHAAGSEPIPQALVTAITAANRAINEASKKSRRLMGMGTTVVAVAVQDGVAYVAHVGDSRVFLIRDGQAQQLTRDHTMVNLFVDAELLSPEEAASHPEAHVLARSLGVEKVVEVEQHAPIQTRPGDTFVLCSDGVHGVIEDWELAEVDWAQPQDAARNVMWTVREREGDDNATVAAVTMGAAPSLSAPTTEVPDAVDLDDARGPGPADTPAPVPALAQAPALPTPSLAMPASSIAKPKANEADAPADAAVAPAAPAARSARDRKVRRKKGDHGTAALVAGVMVAVAAGLLGAVMIKRSVEHPPVEAPLTAVPPVDVPVAAGTPTTPTEDGTDFVMIVTEPVTPSVPELVFRYDPTPFSHPRREPHRASTYTAPPPSSIQTQQAVAAARGQRCAESLALIQKAMHISVNYAPLYTQAWDCFDGAHRGPLLAARPTTPTELLAFEPHFAGTLPESELPSWYLPATDGVEARLAAMHSDAPATLFDVMLDFRGPLRLADEILDDLWVEALAAQAYASAADPDDAVVMAWARHVYQTEMALHGAVGRLLAEYHPEEYQRIVAMLTAATTPPPPAAEGDPLPTLPEPVAHALATARGEVEPPDAVHEAPPPVIVRKPPPPPPPPVDPLSNGAMPEIFRPPGG